MGQYQVIQKSVSDIEVKVVKNEAYDEQFEAHIKRSLRMILGNGINFKLDYVDEIKVPRSGKRRFIISEIAKDRP